MRHPTAGILLAASLWIAPTAHAAMLTLPEDPKGGHRFDIGVDYENTLRRELDGTSASDNDVKRQQAVYARAQYAVHALLNGYARVGTGMVSHKMDDLVMSTGRRDLLFQGDWGMAWGAGATGGLAIPWDLKIGYDVSYHVITSDVDAVTHANRDGTDPAANFSRTGANPTGEITWREYQATAWAARPMEFDSGKFIPYVGLKWSRLRLKDEDVRYTVTDGGSSQTFTVNASSRNAYKLGAILGFRFVMDRFVLIVEGHELDERAVLVSTSWRI